MTTDTFNPGETTPAATPSDSQNAADEAPVLEYGGKAYTKADLLKKLENADSFIETLKKEREDDRTLLKQASERLEKAVSTAELLKTVKETATPASPSAPATPEPIDLEGTVGRLLEKRETETKQRQNFETVKAALQGVYGANADAKVKEVCASLGMKFEDGITLAKNSPEAFKRLFPELSQAVKKGNVPSGDVNPSAFNGIQPKKETGYWKANSAKEQTQAYLDRLKELGT